jgi:F-type H+-transporting ATPase subunit b
MRFFSTIVATAAGLNLWALQAFAEGVTCNAEEGCFEFQIHGYYIINFVVFVGLLVYFGKKTIAQSLEKRYQDVAREIEQAQAAKAAAQAKLAEYQERMGQLEDENQRMLAEVRAGTQIEVEQILADARVQVARVATEEEQRILQESKRLRDTLHRDTATLALRLAEELVKQRIDGAAQQKLIDKALGDLAQLPAAAN